MSSLSTQTKTLTTEPPKRGRPTVFTEEKQASLLDYLSNGGLLVDWCKNHRFTISVVFKFMATEEGESFRAAFHRAREDCAHVFMDQTIKIADETGTRRKPIDPQRQKLRVDTRMRIAGFLNKKQYGTRPGDGEGLGRLTLGELVEEAMRRGAELAQPAQPAMIDVTPGATLAPMRELAHAVMTPPDVPHTEQPKPRRQRRAAT